MDAIRRVDFQGLGPKNQSRQEKGPPTQRFPGKEMYKEFYGFLAEPFAPEPDPRLFFYTPNYRLVLNSMVREIEERTGFILLTGEKGTGKTTLIRKLLQTLDSRFPALFIDQASHSFANVLAVTGGSPRLPAGEGGLEAEPRKGDGQLQKLVVITDDAQELGQDFLEALADFWRSNEASLQQVLVGRPEMEDKLNSWGLRRIKKRISLRCRLTPLTEEESLRYIEHRLREAGGSLSETFVPEALSLICRHSGGIPQTINTYCTCALQAGYHFSRKPVDSWVVNEILKDSRLLPVKELPATPFVERLKARLFPWRVKKFSFSQNLINVQKFLYGEIYGFPRNPFNGRPDVGFYFATENCREVWNSILYGIRQRKGFFLLTGESGVGKTTLLALIFLYLSTRRKEKLIPLFRSPDQKEELLRTLLRNLELPEREETRTSTLSRINEELIRKSSRGEIIILIFDEAQNLKREIVEEILLLADFNPAISKSLQVIFVGDMQFEKRLNEKELSALNQKFDVRCRLLPFTVQESRNYIEHRLHRAGGAASEVLTPKAMTLIAYHCQGIPRALNRLCYEALSAGYGEMKDKVDSESVRKALVKIRRE
jgi:general secretion pathway protein A